MTFGFKLSNTSGITLIDDVYTNICLVSKGTLNITNSYLGIAYITCNTMPIVYIRFISTNKWANIRVWHRPNTATNLYEIVAMIFDSSYNLVTTTVSLEYAVFVPTPLAGLPPPPYGLVVYNQSGGIIYHNGNSVPNICASISNYDGITGPNLMPGANIQLNLDTISAPYLFTSSYQFAGNGTYPYNGNFFSGFRTTGINTVEITPGLIYSPASPNKVYSGPRFVVGLYSCIIAEIQ